MGKNTTVITESTEIEAVGKVLSAKNSDRLKMLFQEIGSILLDSGVVSTTELSGFFQEDEIEELAEPEEVFEVEAMASLREIVLFKRWEDSLNVATSYFAEEFAECLCEQEFAEAREHISSLRSLLMDLANEIPLVPTPVKAGFEINCSRFDEELGGEWDVKARKRITINKVQFLLQEFNHRICLLAECGNRKQEIEDAIAELIGLLMELTFPKSVTPEVADILASASDNSATTYIEASSCNYADNELITFDLGSAVTISAANQGGNRRNFSGVLFRIDEPSESAPSKGSHVPLYVPMSVAQEALRTINASQAIPLDADDSLSRHASKDITGVVTGAEIRGRDFIVHGHLFPWSQPQKVTAITANKDRLGMSMNANAVGHQDVINGTPVFHIDALELLGANILFANRATWQKTRVIAAESAEKLSGNNMEVDQQLRMISQSIEEIAAASRSDSQRLEQQIETLFDTVRLQNQVLSEIQAEREEKVAEQQTELSAQARQAEREELIQAMSAVVEQKVRDAINPHRQPPPLTRPLVEMGIEASGKPANALQVRLIEAEAQLRTLEENCITGTQRISLVDEIAALKARIGYAS